MPSEAPEPPNCAVSTGWPLNINPEMDRHAARLGLSHWSCTSKSSNSWWIRQDGYPYEAQFQKNGGYPPELRAIDTAEPMDEPVFLANGGDEQRRTRDDANRTD